MKIQYSIKFLPLLLILNPCFSHSAEYTFQPILSMGYMLYEFKDNASYFNQDTSFKDSQVYFGLGGTLTHKNYYANLYWQQTGNFSDSTTIYSKVDPLITDNGPTNYYSEYEKKIESDFDQKNISITFGLTSNKTTFFAGYRFSNTNFDIINISESEKRFDEYKYQRYTNQLKLEPDSIDYENNSFFIGCGYNLIFKQGVLGGKITISHTNMETKRNLWIGLPPDSTYEDRAYTKQVINSKDNVFGYALGITWKAPLSQNLNYVLSLDTTQFKSDDVEEIAYILNAAIEWVIPFKTTLIK